jgi:alkylation response protein AidB-like acyl-CoA dehydrogenase
VPASAWPAMLAVARVTLAARSHGEAARTFELATEYVAQRRQFGRPVGSFQAVQHKLADNMIALSGCGHLVRQAAADHDAGRPGAALTAAAAFANATTALRTVSLQNHHAFGAIGYAEEHEAPRHFKRVHVDATRLGGARAAREALAAHYLDDGGLVPDIDLGGAGNAFRDDVEAWLRAHWTAEERAASATRRREFGHDYDHEFARLLGRTGWIGLSWPTEFGGQARGPRENLAFLQVMERHDAPRTGSPVHSAMIMAHGTPEQQRRFLPEMLDGRALHGISYSEPDAGSDLASLRTRARRDGDEYVIDGQKIWTTTYFGEYLLVAARTDPDAADRHAGLSVFMVPADAPGITKRVIATMYDGSFANIFFDGVRVPVSARLGPENDGWRVLTSALGTERGVVGGGQVVLALVRLFELLCDELRARPGACADPVVRQTVGTLAADLEVARQLMTACALVAEGGVSPTHEAAMTKVFAGELHERFGEAVLDLLGPEATLSAGTPGAVADGRFELRLRHALMWVISLGTNEIQRTLIARRGLGLPAGSTPAGPRRTP